MDVVNGDIVLIMVILSEKSAVKGSGTPEWPGKTVSSEVMLNTLTRCEKILESEQLRFHYLFEQPCWPGRERRNYMLRMIFQLRGSLRMIASFDGQIAERTVHAGEVAVGGRGNWNAPAAGSVEYSESCSVIFSHNLIRLVTSSSGENSVYCHYPAPGERLRHLLECANEVINDLNNARSKRIRLLLQVILEQFRIDIANGSTPAAEYPEFVARAVHYIDLNYTGNINCSAVAEALQVNRTQLSELFRRATGKMMKDYILALRLERACWLLKESPMKINRIAAECGFASSGYFVKVFQKKYLTTPLEYRKNNNI